MAFPEFFVGWHPFILEEWIQFFLYGLYWSWPASVLNFHQQLCHRNSWPFFIGDKEVMYCGAIYWASIQSEPACMSHQPRCSRSACVLAIDFNHYCRRYQKNDYIYQYRSGDTLQKNDYTILTIPWSTGQFYSVGNGFGCLDLARISFLWMSNHQLVVGCWGRHTFPAKVLNLKLVQGGSLIYLWLYKHTEQLYRGQDLRWQFVLQSLLGLLWSR